VGAEAGRSLLLVTGEYDYILCSEDAGIATITLNRPERRNAWLRDMGFEVLDAIAAFDADPSVRAIVVTGAGNDFSVGADLSSGASRFTDVSEEERRKLEKRMASYTLAPWKLDTPIIAAINGAAIGVGLTFPLLWDIRIVDEDAKLGFVFNRRGLIPEANSQWLLSRLIGLSRALDLLLTGRIFTGREAAEMGLAARAVPKDQVLATAYEVARDIARNTAPASVAITKKLMYEFAAQADREAAAARETEVYQWVIQQPDAVEGVLSFMQKREPDWKMKKSDWPPS
jgi:enoyl-CoA hydratase/carnithine racemase